MGRLSQEKCRAGVFRVNLSPAMLHLINVLAEAEVRDYLRSSTMPGNDDSPLDSNPPATEQDSEAA